MLSSSKKRKSAAAAWCRCPAWPGACPLRRRWPAPLPLPVVPVADHKQQFIGIVPRVQAGNVDDVMHLEVHGAAGQGVPHSQQV